MPVLNGISATKDIREFLYQNNQIQPIIIGVTGQAEKKYVEKALKSGMNYVLSKPLEAQVMTKFLNLMNYL